MRPDPAIGDTNAMASVAHVVALSAFHVDVSALAGWILRRSRPIR